jgi:uncharacterized protein YdaU (DUF1376 family)
MARCKMDRPERADYFRVFSRHLLMDEDYETLNREEWGSVFLLMLHQWTKSGSLPEDPRKLAAIARCSEAELGELLAKWDKLQPIEGQPGRVGIPYLVKEWEQVMGFYEAQSNRGKASAEAKKAQKSTTVQPTVNHGSTMVEPTLNRNSTNQDQDQDQDQEQKKGPAAQPALALPRGEVLAHWAAVAVPAGLPAVLKLDDKRRKALDARLKDPGWLALFREALDHVARSPVTAWMRGGSDRNWRCPLDYLLRDGQVEKLVAEARATTRAPARASPPRPGGIAADATTQAQVHRLIVPKLARVGAP